MFDFLMRVILGRILNTYWAPCLERVMCDLVFNIFFEAGRVRDSGRFRDYNFGFFFFYSVVI